ncbi:T6SS phospholipase effector Tle1-like catalytic domain-containing protein [Tenacibaculum ovolyticum]|uniref:T6SS phospholipase effector Tle1-like catalytic domain-containing protein n=1 Tax=Tenacibaculum ovolyticum TaxID=104270 RepID=UPI001F23FA50|nr:DUF2235 domain-containing protein [Tenacibaculum ovolyticum]
MSRKRFVKGKTTKITGGNHTMFSKENVVFNAKKVKMKGAEGVAFEDPITLEINNEKPIDVEIGVFFDGTGNNKFNTKTGLKGAPSGPYALKGSYENDYTNVVRLFELYPDKQELIGKRQKVIMRIYVEGIGTLRDKLDDVMSLGTGEDTSLLLKIASKFVLPPFGGIAAESFDVYNGDRGIKGKVNDAISQIVEEIVEIRSLKRIDSLTFDVFGFSRGAAAARHFCNKLKEVITETISHKKYNMGGWQDSSYTETFTTTNNEGGGLYKKLKSKVPKLPEQINVRFVGLFDSVAAILKIDAGDFKIEDASHHGIALDLAGVNAKQVVHLTARDEHRKNFALNKTNVGYSFSMPGVHSDIGGSYNTYKKEGDEEVAYLAYGTKATDKVRLEQERLNWIAEGWYLPDELIVEDKSKSHIKYYGDYMERKMGRGHQIVETDHLYLLKGTKKVLNNYTYIPLRIMHELAKETVDVPFDKIKEDQFEVHPDLEEVYKVLHTIAFTNNSPLISYKDARLLKHKFLHQSANYNNPIIGKSGSGYIYPNEPAKKRIKHTN